MSGSYTGSFTATGDVTAYSDEALKENIVPAPIGMIDSLRGVEFTWKEDGKLGSGVIAQEVEKVLPHLIHDHEDGHKSVNYNGLIAYLIEEVKALREEVGCFVTLPSSGRISAKDINVEYRRWGSSNYEGRFRLYEDGRNLITLGKPAKYSHFYGKSFAQPINSSISGGSFTTSGGNKIGTITNTNAQGCMTINSPATGTYGNTVTYMFVGAGGGGGGGGRSHHYESNGSITGGGGGGGGVVKGTKTAAAGNTYCGKPGKAGAGGTSKNRGTSGGLTTIAVTGLNQTTANGGGGGGSHGNGTNYHGYAGGCGGGGGGRYGTSNIGNGGNGNQGGNGGQGNTGGAGGGGGMNSAGGGGRVGSSDSSRYGGNGGGGINVSPLALWCWWRRSLWRIGSGGSAGNGGGGAGGKSVGGTGQATAGSKQGGGGGGGGATSSGAGAEAGKAESSQHNQVSTFRNKHEGHIQSSGLQARG